MIGSGMWTKEAARAVYPDVSWRGEVDSVDAGDYTPMLESLGEIVVRVDDRDYQGDSRILLRDGHRYGVLLFGWGSCSGCDALQACSTLADLIELRDRLADDVVWHDSAKACAYYIRTKDWGLDRCWHEEESRAFVEQALAALDSINQGA